MKRLAAVVIAASLVAGTALAAPAATAVTTHPAQRVSAGSAAQHSAAAPQAAVPTVAQQPTRRACGQAAKPGVAECLTLIRTNVPARKGLLRPDVTAQAAPAGYGPSDLQSAYDLPSATAGDGATVAIVDAYNNPDAAADLATYRAQYDLPACTVASGCFRVVNEEGQPSPLPADAGSTGWDVEESLDVDMVSAVCPACKIILVEADSSDTTDLGPAVDAAVALGAQYVSNSYATDGEDPTETGLDQDYDHPGVVITAAAGDSGYGVNYPAASPYVTSVGGTTLVQDSAAARGWAETAWGNGASGADGDGTGSGCSAYEPQPFWQTGIVSGCANRATADISAVADPSTGVAIYDSYSEGGWMEVGGTSVATPVIASAYALAGTPASGSYPASYLYAHYSADPSLFNDVTSGSDGPCDPAVLCTAGPGWDGPTGLGTPHGVTGLAYTAVGSVTGTVTDASTGDPIAGATVSTAGLSVTAGSDGKYTLSGLPAGTVSLTFSAYGYQSSTQTVTVTASQTATLNISLTGLPHETLSGTVTAATGTAWPLYAQVSWSDGNGHTGTAYTTPGTGTYSLSLLADSSYTLTVTPLYPGYTAPAAQSVTVGSSSVTKDFTAPVNLADCSAIGYKPVLSGTTEDFTGTGVPSGWSVTNTSLHLPGYSDQPGWLFTNPGGRANTTGGTGNFAIVDSDDYGQFHYQDTELVSPALNFSADTSPAVQFDTDYQPAVNSTATVDVSLDSGKTWTNAWTSHGFPGDPGPATVAVLLPQAAGKSNVRVRFGYTAQWSQYWELDNLFIGQRTCSQQTGALLTGRVTDASGNGVNGATVASVGDPAQTTTTVATPGDDAINGGLYWLFVTGTGSQQFTASDTGYTTSTQTATLTTGQVTTLGFSLAAASTSQTRSGG
jgi:Carboxypeptidase regulatory-like domain